MTRTVLRPSLVTWNMMGNASYCTSSRVGETRLLQMPPVADHRQTADQTSYINYIKTLMVAQELGFPHVVSVIDTTSQWAYSIHPERMVPALKDKDPKTGEQINVFEGTACLQYLADRFDVDGVWSGKTAAERAAVFTWTAYQTAGIAYESPLVRSCTRG